MTGKLLTETYSIFLSKQTKTGNFVGLLVTAHFMFDMCFVIYHIFPKKKAVKPFMQKKEKICWQMFYM